MMKNSKMFIYTEFCTESHRDMERSIYITKTHPKTSKQISQNAYSPQNILSNKKINVNVVLVAYFIDTNTGQQHPRQKVCSVNRYVLFV